MILQTSQASAPSFSVVVSEKGGAERREAFQQAELSIGRVQGNDLMLPKGNVSKRHARLVYRDGRFIVTDLNSTNGTYVNRRRINQATIVRQGDRIYIGDFVLRIEVADDEQSGASDRASVSIPPVRHPMGTAPEISQVSRAAQRDSDATGKYPAVPPAPRIPSNTQPETPPSTREPIPLEKPARSREDSIDADTTAYRSAVRALVERVEERVPQGVLDGEMNAAVVRSVSDAVAQELGALRGEGVIPAHIAEDRLTRDVVAELTSFGPVGALMQDESVAEIAVAGLHSISITRAGRRSHVEPPLSSETSLQRTLKRLCQLSGSALAESETIVERRLPGGLSMSALTGPGVGGGSLIRLERPQRVDATLEDLVRSGTISRAIATFLRHCVAARANVLVVGPKEADTAAVLCALAAAASDGHVVAVLSRAVLVSSNVNVSHVNLAEAGASAERVLALVAALPEARLAVEKMDGPIALGTLEAIGAGADGILAVLRGHTARRGLSRLPSELAAARSGLTPAAAREWVAHAFDVILELAVLRDGRSRVLRVAEPASASAGEIQLTDIFNFVIERTATGGSVEGTFQPTGVIPRIVDEMQARGISVSPALFSRPPSR